MLDWPRNDLGGSGPTGTIVDMSRLRRVPSNRMPAFESGTSAWGWVLLGVLFVPTLALLALAAWSSLVGLGILVAVFLWCVVDSIRERRHHQRLKSERTTDSICGFARSFPRRSVDTWIVRAVYAALSEYRGYPVRASDHITEQLLIDYDGELEYLSRVIAERSGRLLENQAANPLIDKVTTVGDLVRFFQHQPRRKR